MITSAPVLRSYDLKEEVTIQCDASEKGLGTTLLQRGQPVAFASRSLTSAEQNYAQIEKECLAIVFSCERFDQYLHGREMITVNIDHKLLVPIFTKPIHTAPKRLQRMLLRLQKYNLAVRYLPYQNVHCRYVQPSIYAVNSQESLIRIQNLPNETRRATLCRNRKHQPIQLSSHKGYHSAAD